MHKNEKEHVFSIKNTCTQCDGNTILHVNEVTKLCTTTVHVLVRTVTLFLFIG